MVDTWLVVDLEKLQSERVLTTSEHALLQEQYEIMEQYAYQEADIYGDMHQY